MKTHSDFISGLMNPTLQPRPVDEGKLSSMEVILRDEVNSRCYSAKSSYIYGGKVFVDITLLCSDEERRLDKPISPNLRLSEFEDLSNEKAGTDIL